KAVRSWSEHFSSRTLRWLCLGSMGFFYALSLLFRPFRTVQTAWRVVRGRPFTWLERFLHAGFQQYVLRRKVSRLATSPSPARAADRPERERQLDPARQEPVGDRPLRERLVPAASTRERVRPGLECAPVLTRRNGHRVDAVHDALIVGRRAIRVRAREARRLQ